MSKPNIKRALLSVYDKTGLVDFARALHDEFGVELISTGGTARTLKDAGLPVTLVEEVTGFPKMMDGRVKTLHPKIHAAILADRDNPEHMRQLAEQGIQPIDMVVVNLYPFKQTIAQPGCSFEQAIEMIDIGGPCLLRAAAKNHLNVVVVPDITNQNEVLEELRAQGDIGIPSRTRLAAEVFHQTQGYDSEVSVYLLEQRLDRVVEAAEVDPSELPDAELDTFEDETPVLYLQQIARPRYGENPHQQAAVCIEDEEITKRTPTRPNVTSGADEGETPLSFNNYADASAAMELCAELSRDLRGQPLIDLRNQVGFANQSACCFIKHTNACGAAIHSDPVEAYRKAYLGDPNAAMGGILAVNFTVDAQFAEAVMNTYATWGKAVGAGGFFVEVWLAPEFNDDAVQLIRTAKPWGQRVRLLGVGNMNTEPDASEMDLKRIAGGMLIQDRDLVGLNEDRWQVVTERQPTESELNDLRLAWLVCKHTKSNAITICRDGMLIGNGAGQMSRVMSCRIATWLAQENGHSESLRGAVAASDAFFPFRDGPDILADAGVTALIQPGGSKRDEDTIAACNERGLAMIFTGTRHFRH